MINLEKISDEELFNRCKKYGKDALKARQIFAGFLPEVCKRRLYEKKGFDSIYEFAAKLAGLSHDQVDTVIRLERKYEDKPILHAALVEGKISINKLIRIASIATTENQSELFEAAQKLSKSAIDVYVKDFKIKTCDNSKTGIQDGLFTPENTYKALPGQGSQQKILSMFSVQESVSKHGKNDAEAKSLNENRINPVNVDFEIIAALSPELKNKIKELIDKGINVNELFTGFLELREKEIEQKKNEIAEELKKRWAPRVAENGGQIAAQEAEVKINAAAHSQKKPVTRYIPAIVKNIIKQEYGTGCGHPNCKKASENRHHQKKFAIFETHDPRFIKPLCKGHHELEHVNDQNYRHFRLAATG